MSQKYTFFWRFESPFSQHHAANFKVEGKQFSCAEQYYMYKKATEFGDSNTAYKILNAKNPAQQKSLGKKVENFDENIWDQISTTVVYNGNFNKFTQNKRLLNLLLATEGTTLVEASPMDRKWGVGLEASDSRIIDQKRWLGENKLGYILSRLRQDLLKEGHKYNEEMYSSEKNDKILKFWRTSFPFHPKHMTSFSIDKNNFCSLHQYLSYILSDVTNDTKILRIIDQRKLFYNSKKPDFCRHILLGNYFNFNENLNLKAQLLDTAGSRLFFEDTDYNCDKSKGTSSNKIADLNLFGRSLTFLRDLWLQQRHDLTVDTYINEFQIIENSGSDRGFKRNFDQLVSAESTKNKQTNFTVDGAPSIKKIKLNSEWQDKSDSSEIWVEKNKQGKSSKKHRNKKHRKRRNR